MGKNLANTTNTILFCDGGSCRKAGSEMVTREARVYLRNNGLWDTTHTIKTRCNGRCEDAPTCIVQGGDYWYKQLTPEKIGPILESHLTKDEPIEEYLLYREGWEAVASDNERKKVVAPPFALKQDEQFGECWITRGFSSDQYLHPLFVYFAENSPKATFFNETGETFNLQDLKTVVYDNPHVIQLGFSDERGLELHIGAAPKDGPAAHTKQKISVTEYFIETETQSKGIRFKNKMGELKGLIKFDASEKASWDYCLNVQLLGLKNPETAAANA